MMISVWALVLSNRNGFAFNFDGEGDPFQKDFCSPILFSNWLRLKKLGLQ
jgi:hypothetical protein